METTTLAFVGVAVVVALLAYLLTRGGSKVKAASVAVDAIGLKESVYQPFKLIQKTQLNSNTVIFRFALNSPTQRVGLPVGKHMLLRFMDAEGKPISRPYTPVSSDDDLGYFDLLVKLYPLGKMSQKLSSMQIGDYIDARGPQGSLEYTGQGEFIIRRPGGRIQNASVKSVGMIAGGSGITPMLQLLRDVQKRSASDLTRLSLLFANVTESDILLRSELDELREARSLTDIVYTLDKPSESWKGPTGFVTTEMIKTHLPPPASSTVILLCGPKPMVDSMEKNLLALGYTDDMFFKY